MRILILQSCAAEHVVDAARAARERYPHADLIGLLKEPDLNRIRAEGLFTSLQPLRQDAPTESWESAASSPVDLCIIPFESRLGVDGWAYRRFPIVHRIGRAASYNRHKELREYSRLEWWLRSVVICQVIRPIHRPALWLYDRLWRWTDIALLFGLAVVALGVAGVRPLTSWTSWVRPIRRAGAEASSRQRVTLFIPSMGLGGAQRQVISFLSKIDQTRFEVDLALLDAPDKFFEPAVRALGVPMVYLNDAYEFWRAGVVLRLARHLRRQRTAVLHSWLHYAVNLGTIAGALAGVPVLVGSYRSERPSRFPWFYPVWQRAMDILNAPLQTVIIANSEAVRRETSRWAWVPDRKLRTIYNGIETERQIGLERVHVERLRKDIGLPPGAPVVGIVGRLYPEKDHATFLGAAERVLARRSDARFLIVGDGRLQSWIDAEIAQRGLTGRVQALGRRDDALALIELMEVLVLTSRTEGFPNVLLEAALLGTPAVTTAAGGAGEIVADGETGFVVPCGDDEAVAEKILAILENPQLAKQFAEAGRRRVRDQFSADRMVTAISDCYLQALTKTRGLASGRPLRVCLVSFHVYGLLHPSSKLPFGGAEVQMQALALQLANDPRLEVSILTGHQDRDERELHDRISVVLNPMVAKLQDLGHDHTQEPEVGTRKPDGGAGAAPSSLLERGRRRLDALPVSVAGAIRWPVRAWFRLRNRLPSPVLVAGRWAHHRMQEGRQWLAWMNTVRTINADVYVMRCAGPQVRYVQAACRLLRRRFVYMVAHEDDVSGAYAVSRGISGARFERGLRGADAVVCQHEEQLRLLEKQYGRAGILIRSLCPVTPGDPIHTPRRHVLWVARMDEWKQPDLFLDLAERIPEASLVMVGPPSQQDPSNLPRLRERMARLPNLRWLSRVPFEETAKLFKEALVFVNTSRTEGFPNTFLQAAACGTPVVSWMVNPENLFDRYEFGYCVKGDWAEFEGQVRRLCGDKAEQNRLGENGRRFVRRYHDPVVIAKQYADLFIRLQAGVTCRS